MTRINTQQAGSYLNIKRETHPNYLRTRYNKKIRKLTKFGSTADGKPSAAAVAVAATSADSANDDYAKKFHN